MKYPASDPTISAQLSFFKAKARANVCHLRTGIFLNRKINCTEALLNMSEAHGQTTSCACISNDRRPHEQEHP